MTKTFSLNIITSQTIISYSDVVYLNFPGEEGYMGILFGHPPIITNIFPGKFVIKFSDKEKNKVFITENKGFFEFLNNQAKIILNLSPKESFKF